MKIKSKLSVLAVFSCCALASVGFAGWVITQEGIVAGSIYGGVSAESVIVSNDYVYIADKETDISMFTYSESGFVHGDKIDYNGTMYVKFTVNLENCARIADSSNSISVAINLRLNESGETIKNNSLVLGIFNSYTKVSCSEVDKSLTVELGNSAFNNGNGVYTTNLSLQVPKNSSETTATFVLEYNFDFTKDPNAYTWLFYGIFYNSTAQNEKDVKFAFDLLIGN